MRIESLPDIFSVGQTAAVAFRGCESGIGHDTYTTVCAFLNRFGGDLFLGVRENGTVVGVPERAAPQMVRDFIRVVTNDTLLHPSCYLNPELLPYEGRTILHVHVPPSAEVHSYRSVIYDRVDGSDRPVTMGRAIATLYLRKQSIFTEQRIYPYVTMEDLRGDLLPRVRRAAGRHALARHPWQDMDDMQLLQSARLYGTDMSTGRRGFNLAAILLLGRDEVIRNVCPAYRTDLMACRGSRERYDRRETLCGNLVESFDTVMDFAREYMPERLFLEDFHQISLRDILAREVISNLLTHREFSSGYPARLVITSDRMRTENASRAARDGPVTPEDPEPDAKNPIIAAFFQIIGRADGLGTGVRNLFRYSRLYSGRDPQLREGDVFRAVIPLAAARSAVPPAPIHSAALDGDGNLDILSLADAAPDLENTQQIILRLLREDPGLTQQQLQERIGCSLRTIKRGMARLQQRGILTRLGNNRTGTWQVNGSFRAFS